MKKLAIRAILSTISLLVLSGCDTQQQPASNIATTGSAATASAAQAERNISSQLHTLIDEFREHYYTLHPDLAIDNGLHKYDGRLPDYSHEAIAKMILWYESMAERIHQLDDSRLNDREWLYRQQLQVIIDTDLFYLQDMKVLQNNAWYGYSALDPDIYLSRAYAPAEQRMQAFISHLEALRTAIPEIRDNLRPMPSSHARLMRDYMSGLAEFITSTPMDVFADVSKPALQLQMLAATGSTAGDLQQLASWIEKQQRNEDFALHAERYRKMLWSLERIDTPLASLRQLANRDLQQNLQALQEACAVFSPDTGVSECIARANANKFEQGPVAGARQQLIMLKKLLLEKQVVTIPTDDIAVVAEAPPHQRANSAYISRPGPYEKGMPSIYYIAPPDPGWSRDEQLAYIPGRMDLLATSIHEVWPGHFLEGLHSNLSGNPVSELSGSYAFSEGWAHYVEEMMIEEILPDNAEMKIGQLQNALLRNVRFISSLGLHTGAMSVAESEKLFLEKAFNDPGNARQQAARGTFDPGYLFYTVGKLMIKKLRADWSGKYPQKSLQEFHDTFLSFGAAPIPLIRKMMLGRDDAGELFEIAGN